MPHEIKPDHQAAGLRFGIVASRFNEKYVRRLVDGAFETLRRQGAAEDAVTVWWVPGSFELPLAARWCARAPLPGDAGGSGPDAVLALGVLIRGETEHFRLVADAVSEGLMAVTLETGVPVLNGVLAVNDADQAAARAGGALGNRGADVALAAVQMARLRRSGVAT
jgi:6,7-dimethyl-8-ribityllumazine synthase